MPNYAKTIIYRLVCNDTNITECYVGSTTNMIKRKQQHKKDCNNKNCQTYNSKKYIFIRNNGGFINWSMIMIEEYPCENNLQARQRERYWTEYYDASLNMIKAFIDKEESKLIKKEYDKINADKIKKYVQQNADKIKNYRKEYNEKNADKIKMTQNIYAQKNADKIKNYKKEYNEKNADKRKEYAKKNADKRKEYAKKYREKQKLLKNNEEKV